MHRLTQNPLKICIRSPRLRAAGVTLALSAAFFAGQMFSGGQAFAQAACGDEMCPKGFIGLQIHGIATKEPLIMKWRNIRIRPLP